MAMVGHKTEAIYRRYAIVDSGALREAATKIDAADSVMGTLTGTLTLNQQQPAKPHCAQRTDSLRKLVPGVGIGPTRPFRDPGFQEHVAKLTDDPLVL